MKSLSILLTLSFALLAQGAAPPSVFYGPPQADKLLTSGQPAGQVSVSDGNGGSVYSAAATGTVSTPAAVGASPNANGLTITGANINLEPASASFPGVVTASGAQVFGGTSKQFSGAVAIGTASAPLSTYKLGVHGGASNTVIHMTNTTSGTTIADGVLIDMNGTNLSFNLQENGFHNFLINSVSKVSIQNESGITPFFIGNGSSPVKLRGHDTNLGYDKAFLELDGDEIPLIGAPTYLGAHRPAGTITHRPWAATYSKQVMITPTEAATGLPNYELDIRGAAGDSTIQLVNTASGSASTDGALIYLGATSKDLVLTNQEAAAGNAITMRSSSPSGGGIGITASTAAVTGWNFGSTATVSFHPGIDNAGDIGNTTQRVRNIHSAGGNFNTLGIGFSGFTPTHEIQVRGEATDSTLHLTNTVTGNASGDGTLFYIDGTQGNLYLTNQETAGQIAVTADSQINITSTNGGLNLEAATSNISLNSPTVYVQPASGPILLGMNTSDASLIDLYFQNSVAAADIYLQATGELDINAFNNFPIRIFTNNIERESRESSSDTTTTNATVTTLYSKTLTDDTVYLYEARCNARRTDAADRSTFIRRVAVYREAAGGATVQGAVQDGFTAESDATTDLTWDVSSNDVRLRATGVAAKTFLWRCDVTYQKVE